MGKRYSGNIRITVNPREGDTYEVSLKAPGNKPSEGIIRIDKGYTDLHGVLDGMDEASRKYMKMLATEKSPLLKQAASASDGVFHIGRRKSDRWPGGPSSTKTKKGRDRDQML